MAYRKKAVSEQEKKRIAKRFLTGILGIADDGLLKRLEEKAELIDLKKGELYIMEGKSCGKVSRAGDGRPDAGGFLSGPERRACYFRREDRSGIAGEFHHGDFRPGPGISGRGDQRRDGKLTGADAGLHERPSGEPARIHDDQEYLSAQCQRTI